MKIEFWLDSEVVQRAEFDTPPRKGDLIALADGSEPHLVDEVCWCRQPAQEEWLIQVNLLV